MNHKFALPAFVFSLAMMLGTAGVSLAAPISAKAAPNAAKSVVLVKPAEKTAKVSEHKALTKTASKTETNGKTTVKKTTQSESVKQFEKTAKGEKTKKIANVKTEKAGKLIKK